MKQVIWLSALFVAIVVLVSATATQLTTVAIVNVARIYTTFFSESQQVRDFEKTKKVFQDELNSHQDKLRQLQEQRLTALAAKRNNEVLTIEKEMLELQQFINDYRRLKQAQLKDIETALRSGDQFMQELAVAIKYTAESEGYTVVLDKDDPSLRFWSPEVDITDKVLTRLRAMVVR